MTVRNWLELLVVPLVLVDIGLLFEMQQQSREEQRAEAEQALAEQRAQDEALQAYLDQMGNLLLEKNLRESDEGSEVRTLARARTLTVLSRLDSSRKRAVMLFLVEAQLIQSAGRSPIISLNGADLSDAELSGAILRGAILSGAALSSADLTGATGWDTEQLSTANSFEGATMPNGQKYEDWLNSRGEDGENSGHS